MKKITYNLFIIILVFTSTFIGYDIPKVEALSCDDFTVGEALSDGSISALKCFGDFYSARTEMNKYDNGIVLHNSSNSPSKIIAATNAIAVSIPYRLGYEDTNNSVMNWYKYTSGSSLQTQYTYLTSYRDINYMQTEYYNSLTGHGVFYGEINGFAGYADLRQIDIIPNIFIENGVTVEIAGNSFTGGHNSVSIKPTQQYYIKNTNGELLHNYMKYNYGTMVGEYIIGIAPDYMEVNTKYYSWDGIHFYTDSRMKNPLLDEKGNASEYYNYYQYLPLRSYSNITGTQLDQYLEYIGYNHVATSAYEEGGSMLYHQGQHFENGENNFGINSLLTYAIACLESAYGRSHIAVDKNNLYGWGAIDSDPSGGAYHFASVEQSVTEMMGYNLSYYMAAKESVVNEDDQRYHGMSPGNKASGINVSYASDPYWGQKVAGRAYLIDRYHGLVDYNNYTLGLTNVPAVNVRKEATTSSTALFTLDNYKISGVIPYQPVIIFDEVSGESISGNSTWFRINSNYPLNSSRNVEYNYCGNDEETSTCTPNYYDASNSYVYASATLIDYIEATVKEEEPTTPPVVLNEVKTYIDTFDWNGDNLYVKGIGVITDFDYTDLSKISHKLYFEKENGVRTEFSLDTNEGDFLLDLNDGFNYEYGWFEKELDISSLAPGSYSIILEVTIDGFTKEILLRNSYLGNNPADKVIGSNNYKFSKYRLYGLAYQLDISPGSLDITPKNDLPTERSSYFYYNSMILTDNNLDVEGIGYIWYANHSASDNVTYSMVLMDDIGTKHTFPLTTWAGQWDNTSIISTGNDYTNSWFKGTVDLSGLDTGKYKMYLIIETNDYIDYTEFTDEYTRSVTGSSSGTRTYDINVNDSVRNRLELLIGE